MNNLSYGWRAPTIELAHPQGNTITAAVDYPAAVVYVEDTSDVVPAIEWIAERRALHAVWARRGHPSARAFPDWRVIVNPVAVDRLLHP